MSEETKEQGTSQVPALDGEQAKTIEEMMAKKLDEVQVKYRSEINGLNRRNSELEAKLQTQVEEYEKSKLSDAEKHQFELDKKAQELAAREHELNVRSNKEYALKFATENSLPLDMIEVIPMDDLDSVKASLERVKGVVDADRTRVVESFKTKGGDRPSPGGSAKSSGLITRDDIKGMSPEAINAAWNEGRVKL